MDRLYSKNQDSLQSFDESGWLDVIFKLRDAQQWIAEAFRQSLLLLPLSGKKRLRQQRYYLSLESLVHILEKHYDKIHLYPLSGKFTIPVTEILSLLMEGSKASQRTADEKGNYIIMLDAGRVIGYDQDRQVTSLYTIITDAGGRVITAYPFTNLSKEL